MNRYLVFAFIAAYINIGFTKAERIDCGDNCTEFINSETKQKVCNGIDCNGRSLSIDLQDVIINGRVVDHGGIGRAKVICSYKKVLEDICAVYRRPCSGDCPREFSLIPYKEGTNVFLEFKLEGKIVQFRPSSERCKAKLSEMADECIKNGRKEEFSRNSSCEYFISKKVQTNDTPLPCPAKNEDQPDY